MKKYRIIERTNSYSQKWYCVQKKSIFGWWYNDANVLATSHTGWYSSLHEAEFIFRAKTTPVKTRVVKTTENQ